MSYPLIGLGIFWIAVAAVLYISASGVHGRGRRQDLTPRVRQNWRRFSLYLVFVSAILFAVGIL